MEEKIKVIIKRPDEPAGHMTWIHNNLKNLQRNVDGPIEVVSLGGGILMICNEEGKIRNLEPNFRIPNDLILGDVIICGVNGEEFGDVPISMKMWKSFLQQWGN